MTRAGLGGGGCGGVLGRRWGGSKRGRRGWGGGVWGGWGGLAGEDDALELAQQVVVDRRE
ncbi:hypothetical protein EKG83_09395 [Saccharothrix syringae]|uniref:Uncharacterized protein n=1 Tax=Saccharothrix syringae TaxID=103733 RepID=A0A5Q0GUN5_SACSY|nr:hypothetical protein EKG83_09395 [Saccharothrix syringae]